MMVSLFNMATCDEIYQALILDHSRRPRNYHELPPPALRQTVANPLCGDELALYLRLGPAKEIQQVIFTAQACAICTAATSLLTTRVKGKTIEQALELAQAFDQLLTSDFLPEEQLGDLVAFVGIRRFPQRYHCAALGWQALSALLRSTRPG